MDRPARWEQFRSAADRIVEEARAILHDALPWCAATTFWLKAVAMCEKEIDVSLAKVVARFSHDRLSSTGLAALLSGYVTNEPWTLHPDGHDPYRILFAARLIEGELAAPKRVFELYSPAVFFTALEDVLNGGGDSIETFVRLAKLVAATGNRRALARLPTDLAFAQLAAEMPNFAEVVQFYAGQAALSRLGGDEIARFPPVLLLGPPGIGKTRFAERLAAILGSVCRRISMASASAGWIVSGLDRSWGNAKPGQILMTLVSSQVANAVVLVDEIDKAGGDHRYDPLGGFYSLLEFETARLFTDECLGFPVDASALIWIATANCAESIPEPIRSRMTVFNVEAPSGSLARQVVRRVFEEVTDGKRVEPLDEAVVDLLVQFPPRELKARLRAAAGSAARRTALSGDAMAAIRAEDIPLPPPRPKIGFV